MAAVLSIVTLGLRAATMTVIDILVASTKGVLNLHIVVFLVSSGNMVSLSLDSKVGLPFVAGMMSIVSPRGHFSPMIIPFTAKVDVATELAPLDPPAIWSSFFRLILFYMIAKRKINISKRKT